MKLFLQTSSGQPALALWDGSVLFEKQFGQMQRLDYGQVLSAALAKTGRMMDKLDGIVVDIGPGRLGSTRTAVAFANGLGFARGIPVTPISSFLTLGVYSEKTHDRPCLVLRKAARRQYHWALVSGSRITETGFATDGQVAPKTYAGPVVVAGDAVDEPELLPTLPDALWPGLNTAPAAALSLLAAHLHPAQGPVVPLVETDPWVATDG